MKYEFCWFRQIAIGCAVIMVICVCLYAMHYALIGRG